MDRMWEAAEEVDTMEEAVWSAEDWLAEGWSAVDWSVWAYWSDRPDLAWGYWLGQP